MNLFFSKSLALAGALSASFSANAVTYKECKVDLSIFKAISCTAPMPGVPGYCIGSSHPVGPSVINIEIDPKKKTGSAAGWVVPVRSGLQENFTMNCAAASGSRNSEQMDCTSDVGILVDATPEPVYRQLSMHFRAQPTQRGAHFITLRFVGSTEVAGTINTETACAKTE